MTQNTSLRKKAMIWWNSLTPMAKRDIYKNNKPSNIYIYSFEEIETIYLKEHPTEAEVSNEEETVEQACKLHYENLMLSANKAAHNLYETGFYSGSNWQKEKDRVLISELLKIVETLSESVNSNDYSREFKDEVRKAITKAEKHLNNQ